MQFKFKTSLISKLKSIYNVQFPERILKGIRQHTISVNTYCLLNKLSLKSSVKMTWQIIHYYALNPLIYLTKVTTISHAHTIYRHLNSLSSSCAHRAILRDFSWSPTSRCRVGRSYRVHFVSTRPSFSRPSRPSTSRSLTALTELYSHRLSQVWPRAHWWLT